MIRAFRLYRKHRRNEAFSGEGARLSGARWNLAGTPAVYCSSTLALCLVELFVHLDPTVVSLGGLGLEYRYADIPEDLALQEVTLSELPRDWRRFPWPKSTQILGTRLLKENQHAVISVPSVIVPLERNYLLNPLHPEFSRITLGSPTPFDLDSRLFKLTKKTGRLKV